MKVKILSLLLSVTLLFFAVIPASAAEDIGRYNVFDFCMPNDGSSMVVSVSSSNNYVSFNPGLDFLSSYFDIYLYFQGTIPTAVNFLNAYGSYLPLTMTPVGGNTYRIQGNISGYFITEFKLEFITTGNCDIQFYSFFITTRSQYSYIETGKAKLETYSFSPVINFNINDTVNGRSWTGQSDPFISVSAYIPDWKLYDRLDFYFYFACNDLMDITVYQGSTLLDFDMSYHTNAFYSNNEYYVMISVDLSNVNKRSTDIPTVYLEGKAAVGEENTFTVLSMSGTVYLNSINPVTFWLQKLNLSFDQWWDLITTQLFDIINHLKGDTASADSFNDQADQKNEELQNMVGIMDSVQRPDINQLNPSLTIQNAGADIAGGIGPVLTVPMQNPIILQVLILSLTFAMIAYVLYGKR